MKQLMMVRVRAVPVPSCAVQIRLSPALPVRLVQGPYPWGVEDVRGWHEGFGGQSNGEQGKKDSDFICR